MTDFDLSDFLSQHSSVKEALNELANNMQMSLEDKIKLEHFVKIFDKYSSSQIEKLLPE